MKLFINKHLHLPITVPLKGKWKPEAARAHLWVPSLGSAGLVVMGSGSPKASASLTNWIKLRWWKTSCIPLWTPRSAGLGRNSRLIIPVLCVVWSWGRGSRAEQGWVLGLEQGGGRARPRTQGAAASAACRWHRSDSYLPLHAKRKWAVVQTTGGFPFGTLSHSSFFILFYLLDFKFSLRHRNVWVPCQQRRDLCAVQIIVCLCLAQNPSYNIFLTN